LARKLRIGSPAVFPRVQEGCTLIDMRTVLAEDDDALLGRLVDVLSGEV
jgi:hypothetical protein